MAIRQPGELVALARARRSFELGRLPGWGTAKAPLVRQRLHEWEGGVSSGTLVALLRKAMRQRQTAVSQELFLLLLQRTEAGSAFWAQQTLRKFAGIAPEAAQMMREDLGQDLTVYLWEELALRDHEGWELFFRRSLGFARAGSLALSGTVRLSPWPAPDAVLLRGCRA